MTKPDAPASEMTKREAILAELAQDAFLCIEDYLTNNPEDLGDPFWHEKQQIAALNGGEK